MKTAEYRADRSRRHVRRVGGILIGALSATMAFAAVPAPATVQADPSRPEPMAGFDPPKSSGVVLDRSSQGVPHITAPNYEKLAYGAAWTMAEDDLCGMAFDGLKARGELAQTFGREPVEEFTPNEGIEPFEDNVASDLYYKLLQHRGYPERGLRGPQAPSARARASVRGYVRGYNDFLERHPNSDPRCAGEPWVKPRTERDVWLGAHQYDDWEFDFAERLNAEPPARNGSQVSAHAAGPPAPADSDAETKRPVPEHSQAIALGDRVTGDGAIVAYDPHNPAETSLDPGFARLTIPGRLDVFGHRSRFSPALYAGANANFSWALTFSHQQRRVIRRLKLAPGSPTSYIVDGKTIPMGRDRVSVKVREPDGTFSRRTHTFYKTKWGDVLVRGDGSGRTDLPWTKTTAYATDESAIARTSQRLFDYHLDINRAQSFADLRALVARWGGFLDSQLTGADTSGRTYFFGGVGAPNIDAQHQERCINDARAQAIFEITGEPVLDGSTTDCALPSQPGAFRPGTVGVDGIPQLQSRLYTANGNNSHWLVTRSRRLEGFNPFFTDPLTRERAQVTPRARLILSMAEELVGRARTSGRPLDAAAVARAFLEPRDSRSGPELDGVVAWCRDQDTVRASDGALIDVSAACDVLARWDQRHRVDSRGGTLWRLFWAKLFNHFSDTTLPMRTPYSVEDPINTPRGLRFTRRVAATFADAVQAIRNAGLPLDVSVGDTMRLVRWGTDGPEFPGRGCGMSEMLGCNVVNYNDEDLDQVRARTDGSGTHAAFVAQLRPHGPATVKYYTPLQVRNPSSPWYWSNIDDYYSTMRTSTLHLRQPRKQPDS